MSKLLKPFYNPSAWILIILGAVLFAGRARFAPGGWADLPELATFIELVGGLFILLGFQLMASMLFWPDTRTAELLGLVANANSVAAAIVLAGLKVFNGLSIIGFAIWLALAMNGTR